MTDIKYSILDTITMSKRCMLLSIRNLDAVITSVLLPAMMMLLFVYLFGGTMNVGDVDYVNYVVPGVLILSIGYCAAVTAVSINTDMTKGIIDRFRSMPIAKSSVLAGHVFASVGRNFSAAILVVIVALIIGFRPAAGFMEWLIAAGILLLYMLVITWSAVLFGLVAKSADGAGTFSFFILFFPYLSSGFVPPDAMPAFLRVFSENQPLTPIIEAIRSLLMHSAADEHLLPAVLWCVGLLLLSYAASMQVYRYKARS